MKRNKVTGKGVELLDKIAMFFDEDIKKDQERVGFIQVRLAAPKQKKVPARKPPKKKDGDKNLSYNSCSPEIQKGLRKSRAKEWQKWKRIQCRSTTLQSRTSRTSRRRRKGQSNAMDRDRQERSQAKSR